MGQALGRAGRTTCCSLTTHEGLWPDWSFEFRYSTSEFSPRACAGSEPGPCGKRQRRRPVHMRGSSDFAAGWRQEQHSLSQLASTSRPAAPLGLPSLARSSSHSRPDPGANLCCARVHGPGNVGGDYGGGFDIPPGCWVNTPSSESSIGPCPGSRTSAKPITSSGRRGMLNISIPNTPRIHSRARGCTQGRPGRVHAGASNLVGVRLPGSRVSSHLVGPACGSRRAAPGVPGPGVYP